MQGRHRPRDLTHAKRPSRREKTQQPRQRLGQIGPAHGKRSERIGEETRHSPEQVRHAEGNAGAGTDQSGIAEGAAFARRPRIDDSHLVSGTLQIARAGNADNAGADDGKMRLSRHPASPSHTVRYPDHRAPPAAS
jgi:hypothetical protein